MDSLIEVVKVGGKAADISSVSYFVDGVIHNEHSSREYDRIFDSIEKHGFALIKGAKTQNTKDKILIAGEVSALDITDAANISQYAFSELSQSAQYVSASFLKLCADGSILVAEVIK